MNESSPEKSWTVVKFIDDLTVAAVPTIWIHNNSNECYWPPFSAEKLSAAIKHQQMNTCWPTHKIQVFRNATYESYEVARQKAKRAEDTSDLNTDIDESNEIKKRVVKKKSFLNSESDSDVENVSYVSNNGIKPKMPCLGLDKNHIEMNMYESSPARTWTVVKFIDDLTVAAVPTIWININSNECFWPPFSADKLSAAIKHQQMNTCWPTHKIQVFRNATYESYEVARQKAKRAEDTSDLNTDIDESKEIRKRIIKKKVFSDSESDSEVENVCVKKNDNKPKTPCLVLEKEPNTSNMRCIETELMPVAPSSKVYSKQTQAHLHINKEASAVQSDIVTKSSKCQCYCPKHAEINAEILRQLYFLRSVYTELITEIKNLKGLAQDDFEGTSSVLQKFQLPISTEEGLQELETFLKTPENFNKIESELCKFGGSNLLDFVKRCMGMLISNKLAANFSWLGRRTKKAFKDYEMVAQLIINAALKAGKCKDKKEAEQEIARWLRRAPDRLKSYQDNTNTKETNREIDD